MAEEQPTCGKGIAAAAGLQTKLAGLTIALARLLEYHMTALDPSEPGGRAEHQAYGSLASGLREISTRLEAVSREMEGYRDLPMAVHDMEVMAGQATVFADYVSAERDLASLLQESATRDEEMLAAMRGAKG